MILALSILAGLLTAGLGYRVLFYDRQDFWDGYGKLLGGGRRRPKRWIWSRDEPPPPPETYEDESWSSGLRCFILVAATLAAAYLAYRQLHQHFG